MSTLKRKIEVFREYARYFGVVEAVAVSLSVLFGSSFDGLKKRVILDYLKRNYSTTLSRYKNTSYPKDVIPDDAPVWTFWAQGEESMPDMVVKCIELIRRHANDRKVYVLDMKNVKDYVSIDEGIYSMLHQGQISFQHFSDIVRCSLLSKYGGFWIDACVFLTGDLPHVDNCFYSVHTMLPRMPFSNKWLIGFHASTSGNPLHLYLLDILTEYHLRKKPPIDYLLMDYALLLAYENIPSIKRMIDEGIFECTDFAFTAKNINNVLSATEMNSALRNNIVMRASYKWKAPQNKEALYWKLFDV